MAPVPWFAWQRARVLHSGWPVHLGVAAAVALYAFAVCCTRWLAVLDGYHPHALVVLAAIPVGLGHRAGAPFRSALCVDGLLLAARAILLSLAPMSDRGAAALFLAAGLYGYAGLVPRSRLLPGIAVVLLNLALFSVWQEYGVVDPAFYGVPAGLTLLLGAEVARNALTAGTRSLLWWGGIALAYGSVALGVLRVDEPAHALVLFATGLLAIALGLHPARRQFLLAGTAAVVLDVIAYLARHGLERDFIGSALLVGAGLTVLASAAILARGRKLQAGDEPSDVSDPAG